MPTEAETPVRATTARLSNQDACANAFYSASTR